jgi:hypothetical protein
VVLSLQGLSMTIGRARDLLLVCAATAAFLGACSSGGSTTGDAATACGTSNCAPGQVCVRMQTVGGAQNCPEDGGTCPGGYELNSSGCCEMIPSWSCVARPSGCGATLTCACAQTTLCSGGESCTMPRDNEIDCTLLAP